MIIIETTQRAGLNDQGHVVITITTQHGDGKLFGITAYLDRESAQRVLQELTSFVHGTPTLPLVIRRHG